MQDSNEEFLSVTFAKPLCRSAEDVGRSLSLYKLYKLYRELVGHAASIFELSRPRNSEERAGIGCKTNTQTALSRQATNSLAGRKLRSFEFFLYLFVLVQCWHAQGLSCFFPPMTLESLICMDVLRCLRSK